MEQIKRNNKIEDINNKYDVLLCLIDLLNIENRLDIIYENLDTFKHFINLDTFDEILILSTFVRKNIYVLQLDILENKIDCDVLANIDAIKTILKILKEVQSNYIDFIFDRCVKSKATNFDSTKCDKYKSIISEEIKKLQLKNN